MTILENKPVDYNHPLLPPLVQNFKLEHPIQMHCFWRGTFGEKQFGSLKSLFATQKSYEYNVTLWYTGTLTIDKSIESEFAEFRKRYNDRFQIKEFVVEREIDQSDERLKGLKKILVKDEKGASQFFADDVRVTCLYKYGGLYFDLDCLFLRDMKDTYSYHNFCYAWEWQSFGNTAIMYIDKSCNDTIKQIVDVAIQGKSCHPRNIVSYDRQYDEFYILPCWCFDPIWEHCVKGIGFKNYTDVFADTNMISNGLEFSSISKIYPCSFVFHWHNKWNNPIHDQSLFNQIMAIFGGYYKKESKLNFITNSCIGGFTYQYLGLEYQTPFIWNIIEVDDFVKLVENYDNINFRNVKFGLEQGQFTVSVTASLDDKVTIHFIHLIQSEKDETPRKDNNNILYKDILTYARKQWFRRVDRISGDEPIFEYQVNNDHQRNVIIDFLGRYNSRYKVFITTYRRQDYDELKKLFPNNIDILFFDTSWQHMYAPRMGTAIINLQGDKK